MQKIIQSTFYFLIATIPLVFTTVNYELFEFPKFIILISATIIISVAWISDSIKNHDWKLPRSPLNIPVLAFLASQILSTIFSIDPHTSFWGYYSRFHQGLLATICYTILYFAYLKYMNKKSTLTFIKVSVSTAFAISLYGILEHFGIDKNLWVQDVQNRVFSTLGQPNWLAAYILPNLFLGIYLQHKAHSTSKYLYYLIYGVFVTTLLFTKSRSGILAGAISLVVFWLPQYTKNRAESLQSIKHYLGIAVAIAFLIGTPWSPRFTDIIRSAKTPKLETAVQVASQGTQLEIGGSKSTEIRRIVWSGAFDLAKRYPVLGTGVETFAYSYYWTRPVDHNYVSEWDFLYNKAHNEYLNLAATSGLLGLFTHLALYGFLCYHLVFKILPQLSAKNPHYLELAVGASLVSIGITNFFGFSVIPITTLMYLLPAMIFIKSDHTASKNTKVDSTFWIITVLLLIIPARIFIADLYFIKGKNLISQPTQAIPLLEKAIRIRPREAIFYSFYAETLATYTTAAAGANNITRQQVADLEYRTINAVDMNKTLNNSHLNFYKSRAKVYLAMAPINSNYNNLAAKEVEEAVILAPTDAKLYYNLGLIYSRLGRNDEAIIAMNNSIELKTNYDKPYYALTLLYEENKQVDLITPLLENARSNLATYGSQLQDKFNTYLIN